MRSASFVPAMAGLFGVSHALLPGLVGDLPAATFDLATSWDNEVLFEGIAGVVSETDAALNVGLKINEAQIEGLVAVEYIEGSLVDVPLIRLDLSGVKAYFDVDISTTAAIYETIQLVASPELSLDTGILDVALGAAFALDLVVGVGAAVDLNAGFYVSFAAGDYIDISAVTKKIVTTKLDGVLAKALPIGVGANVDLSTQVEVQLGLRLRSHVSVEAGLDLLGLELLEAGADVSIWADLAAYTIVLVETANCVLAIDSQFALHAGVAVQVGLELLDLLDLSLAPEVTVKLAATVKDKLCLNSRGKGSDFLIGGGSNGDVEGDEEASDALSSLSITGTVTATPVGNATVTAGPGMITSTISNTKTYTITSCHVSVPNCPATETQVIITSTVEKTVTVCPAESTEAAPEPTSTKTKPTKPVHTITETLTTVVPCEPTTSTYTPPPTTKPPVVPTVTITKPEPEEPTKPAEEPTKSKPASEIPTGSVTIPVSTPEPEKPTTKPSAPGSPVPIPTPIEPVEPTVPGVPIPVPTGPAPNSTFISVTPPASTWTPPTTIPTPPPPAETPIGAAGALKVGVAMVVPVFAALLL